MLEGRKRNREKGSKGHSLKSISSMCFLTAQPKLEFFVYLFIYLSFCSNSLPLCCYCCYLFCALQVDPLVLCISRAARCFPGMTC